MKTSIILLSGTVVALYLAHADGGGFWNYLGALICGWLYVIIYGIIQLMS